MADQSKKTPDQEQEEKGKNFRKFLNLITGFYMVYLCYSILGNMRNAEMAPGMRVFTFVFSTCLGGFGMYFMLKAVSKESADRTGKKK